MATNLVIVESQAKAKTIQTYLNKCPELKSLGSFQVMASFGHITEMPLSRKGYDPETWSIEYEPIAGKESIIQRLKNAGAVANVYLASDADLEGEAIAWHLATQLGLDVATTHRIMFNEITQQALKNAILSPTTINVNKVNAQQTRRVVDRIVGYEVSPLLWKHFAKKTLSAGRVQSAALYMIVFRSQTIDKHVPEKFWSLNAKFNIRNQETAFEVDVQTSAFTTDKDSDKEKDKNTNTEKDNSYKAHKLDEITNMMERVRLITSWTSAIEQKEVKKSPPPPFTTSSLQQEAYTSLRINAKTTMKIAQELYEKGFITYMRTDCQNFSKDARTMFQKYIVETFGKTEAQPRTFGKKMANAQEAHEAIRPTSVKTAQELGLDGFKTKLYDLIWKRSIASQMKQATYAEFTYTVTSPKFNQLFFRGSHSILIDPGYLRVYGNGNGNGKKVIVDIDDVEGADGTDDDDDDDDKYNGGKGNGNEDFILNGWKQLVIGTIQTIQTKPLTFNGCGDVSKPPQNYNEPGLIKALEKAGIGRPSTYATIIDKLYSKMYVRNGQTPEKVVEIEQLETTTKTPIKTKFKKISVNGKEKDRMLPTELGTMVVEYLMVKTPFLLDIGFTADMEKSLDEVTNGTDYKTILTNFYQRIRPLIDEAKAEAANANDTNAIQKLNQNIQFTINETMFEIKESRYGPVIFNPSTKKYIDLKPFMKWKKKDSIGAITEHDVAFIVSLPKDLGNEGKLCYGRYGLYLSKDGKNVPIEKKKWNSYY